MAANINDKFSEVSTGTRPTTTTVASIRSVSGTSLVCDDLTGWATDTAVHFVTYQVDGQGNIVAGTQTDMKGIVSGDTIGSITVTGGTDVGNDVGDIVQQLPTAAWAKDLADGLQVAHNLDGSLSAGIVDTTELADEAVTTDKIEDEAVTTDKIDEGAVTAVKRSGGFKSGSISLSSTGDKVVSLGFKPKGILFIIAYSNANNSFYASTGFWTEDGGNMGVGGAVGTSGEFRRSSSTRSIISTGTSGSALSAEAYVSSVNSDGFTVTVVTSDSSSVYYMAMG